MGLTAQVATSSFQMYVVKITVFTNGDYLKDIVEELYV